MSEKIKPEFLHLYPGAFWHSDGAIVGTREGLAELRDALDSALRSGNAVAGAVVKDGEGYCIYVHRVSDEDMEKMALPYTDEMAAESEDSDALWPHQLGHRAEEAYCEKFLRPNAELRDGDSRPA